MVGDDLASVITELRSQLQQANATRPADAAVLFQIDEVKVELQMVLTNQVTGSAEGGLLFKVVKLSTEGQHTNEATHKITLKMKAVGRDGEVVKVSGPDVGHPD
jgi:predicted secreted protein